MREFIDKADHYFERDRSDQSATRCGAVHQQFLRKHVMMYPGALCVSATQNLLLRLMREAEGFGWTKRNEPHHLRHGSNQVHETSRRVFNTLKQLSIRSANELVALSKSTREVMRAMINQFVRAIQLVRPLAPTDTAFGIQISFILRKKSDWVAAANLSKRCRVFAPQLNDKRFFISNECSIC